jgi:hypothetical protein
MNAYLHLAHDAEEFVKRMADSQGRVPVQEHYPEVFIDGEDAYLLDYSQLTNQQRIELVMRVAVTEDISVNMAKQKCLFGIPIGRSQATCLELQGEMHSLEAVVYAPESPTPWGFEPEEVVF